MNDDDDQNDDKNKKKYIFRNKYNTVQKKNFLDTMK